MKSVKKSDASATAGRLLSWYRGRKQDHPFPASIWRERRSMMRLVSSMLGPRCILFEMKTTTMRTRRTRRKSAFPTSRRYRMATARRTRFFRSNSSDSRWIDRPDAKAPASRRCYASMVEDLRMRRRLELSARFRGRRTPLCSSPMNGDENSPPKIPESPIRISASG